MSYPKFSKGGKFYFSPDVWEFNLPAGHTCPYSHACKLKADRETGKIVKGNGVSFPCYAATCERYPSVRKARWGNFDVGNSCNLQGVAVH